MNNYDERLGKVFVEIIRGLSSINIEHDDSLDSILDQVQTIFENVRGVTRETILNYSKSETRKKIICIVIKSIRLLVNLT